MEINIPQQQIHANSKGGLINEGGVMSSECGNTFLPEENGMHPMVFGFSNIKTIQTKSGAKSLGLRLSMTPPLYVDLN